MSAISERIEGLGSRQAPAEPWPVAAPRARPGLSPGCGRGLFAIAPIVPGEIVERACTVPITPEQALALDLMRPVGDFYFAHPLDAKAGLMVFGMASLLNHSDRPNADIRFVEMAGLGWVCELYALAPIATDEEITYRYRCPLWFDAAG